MLRSSLSNRNRNVAELQGQLEQNRKKRSWKANWSASIVKAAGNPHPLDWRNFLVSPRLFSDGLMAVWLDQATPSPKQSWEQVWVKHDPTAPALKKETCFLANRPGRKSPIVALFSCAASSCRLLTDVTHAQMATGWGFGGVRSRSLWSGPQWTCSRLGNTSKLVSPNSAERSQEIGGLQGGWKPTRFPDSFMNFMTLVLCPSSVPLRHPFCTPFLAGSSYSPTSSTQPGNSIFCRLKSCLLLGDHKILLLTFYIFSQRLQRFRFLVFLQVCYWFVRSIKLILGVIHK